MKITLRKLSTKELATLGQRILQVSKSGKHSVIDNHPLLVALEEQYALYEKAYAKAQTSGKGLEVANADRARDEAYNSLKNFLKGYAGMSLLPNQADAVKLLHIFEQLGTNIPNLNYAEETAQMKHLIQELEKEENYNLLVNLSIDNAFADLKTKQEAFESLYIEQSEANAELRKTESASSARRELEKRLRSYIDFVSALKNVPDYISLYNDLNELIKGIQ